MEHDLRATAARPRIWAIGMSRLGELFQEILPAFDEQAEIRLVTLGFDEAVAEIGRARPGDLDVVVAAGSNGAYLRSRVGVPVVLVNVNGSDALHALSRARGISKKVGLVSHGDSLVDFASFADVFELEIPNLIYRNADEARAAVFELREQGVEVVVGPGLVTEIAEREGLESVFLYSRASIEAAIDTALEVARGARIEANRRERLDAVLRHLRDGVVATDLQWRVQAINPRMARILGIVSDEVLGKRLQEIAPSIDWLMLAREANGVGDGIRSSDEAGLSTAESVQTIEGKAYAVTRVEVLEAGRQTGFVTTFQETSALQRIDRSLRSRHRPRHLVSRYSIDDLLGESTLMAEVRELARRYATTQATVLVLGETGTGKEIVAQGIHAASDRRDYPFVALNCGAFPESLLESELFGYDEGAFTGARRGGKAGLIETAHRGTLFLDEIAEMPLPLQTRLLRVLQEKEVMRIGSVEPMSIDVRVIAATHQPLAERVSAGTFRQDLFYRLNILQIKLPALRERVQDIPALATALLELAKQRGGLSGMSPIAQRGSSHELDTGAVLDACRQQLMSYDWPGNVRELENFIERIVVWNHASPAGKKTPFPLASIVPELGTDLVQPRHNLKQASRREEAARIVRLLHESQGDQEEVCRKLGISRSTLWRRLKSSP
jgi:transcriptional regulator, propionate catabolism operon regulatory protein